MGIQAAKNLQVIRTPSSVTAGMSRRTLFQRAGAAVAVATLAPMAPAFAEPSPSGFKDPRVAEKVKALRITLNELHGKKQFDAYLKSLEKVEPRVKPGSVLPEGVLESYAKDYLGWKEAFFHAKHSKKLEVVKKIEAELKRLGTGIREGRVERFPTLSPECSHALFSAFPVRNLSDFGTGETEIVVSPGISLSNDNFYLNYPNKKTEFGIGDIINLVNLCSAVVNVNGTDVNPRIITKFSRYTFIPALDPDEMGDGKVALGYAVTQDRELVGVRRLFLKKNSDLKLVADPTNNNTPLVRIQKEDYFYFIPPIPMPNTTTGFFVNVNVAFFNGLPVISYVLIGKDQSLVTDGGFHTREMCVGEMRGYSGNLAELNIGRHMIDQNTLLSVISDSQRVLTAIISIMDNDKVVRQSALDLI